MKKKSIFALLLAMLVLCLSGCRSGYTRTEVKGHTWKILRYSPFFTLSKESVPIWNHNHYRNYIWTVKTIGWDPLEFRVVEAHGSSTFWGTVRLVTDYSDVVLAHEAEKSDGLQHFTLETDWEDSRLHACLDGSFSTREELDILLKELKKFRRHLNKHYNLKRLEYHAGTYTYPFHLRLATDWPDSSGDCNKTVSLRFLDVDPNALSKVQSDFLRYAIDYQHPFKDDFTQEEICAAVALGDAYRIGVSPLRPEIPFHYYDDLCNVYSDESLSYRTLYEIMIREGIPVEGTVDHFTFQGYLGQSCEFSDDFFDMDESGIPHYYHLIDGEKIEDSRKPRIKFKEETDSLYLFGLFLDFQYIEPAD